MSKPLPDDRSQVRRARDEEIAAQPPLKRPDLPADSEGKPVEAHLAQQGRRPFAVAGRVENGVVRPLDPTVKLPEHARVIIVAADER